MQGLSCANRKKENADTEGLELAKHFRRVGNFILTISLEIVSGKHLLLPLESFCFEKRCANIYMSWEVQSDFMHVQYKTQIYSNK